MTVIGSSCESRSDSSFVLERIEKHSEKLGLDPLQYNYKTCSLIYSVVLLSPLFPCHPTESFFSDLLWSPSVDLLFRKREERNYNILGSCYPFSSLPFQRWKKAYRLSLGACFRKICAFLQGDGTGNFVCALRLSPSFLASSAGRWELKRDNLLIRSWKVFEWKHMATRCTF